MKLEIPVREGLLYSEIATVTNKGDIFTPTWFDGAANNLQLGLFFVSRYSSIVHVLHKFIP